MIFLYKIQIINAKTKELVKEIEMVGGEKSEVENEPYYKRHALRIAGIDPNLEKWDSSKYIFKAEEIKKLDYEIVIK